ncbi:hypothetical protein C1H46_000334 [Malus baccata]|uniref:Uncharacterized protein n=1 Tax=Malus baccata TaxID=106549 RepID=A0A540NU22_MALBA|nr:hypothetical protein C1H46_000334 [Malus baccata]
MCLVDIVCRVPVYTSAQVFPTLPLFLCCLPIPAVSLVGFHELHIGSWLLLLSCQPSLVYDSAQVANQGWRWHLIRQYMAVNRELDGLIGTLAVENAVEASGFGCCVFFFWTLLFMDSFVFFFCS